MRTFIVAAVIGMAAAGSAGAVDRDGQQVNARPGSIDPRQVGDYGVNENRRTKVEIERAKCLKRKVKERRDCLAPVKTITQGAAARE